MSRVFVCGSRMPTASFVSSGEREGFEYSAASPMEPSFLPLRSNHCGRDWKDWKSRRHTSTPLGEAAKVAAGSELPFAAPVSMWSATGRGSPPRSDFEDRTVGP